MLKVLLNKLSLTTTIIIYLYICGGLYLISFWQVFDLDITNIVSLTDIPKAFIYPFFLIQGVFFLGAFIRVQYPDKNQLSVKNVDVKKFRGKANFIMVLIFLSLFVFNIAWPSTYFAWLLYPLFLVAVLTAKIIVEFDFLKIYIPQSVLRVYVYYLLLGMPIFSFCLGKYKGNSIYYNKEIQYISAPKRHITNNIYDSTEKKLLGFLGDKVIVGDLDNKKLWIIRQDAMDSIEISRHTEK